MRPIDADALVAKLNLIFGHNDFFDETDESWEQAFKVGVAHAVKEINHAETIAKLSNNPLTLEQLREMDGEPVWMTIPGENGGEWVIARNIDLGDVCIFCPVGAKRQYGADGSGAIGDYGKTWLAYRRKPEEGTT